jgi:hypothetical protein
VIFFRVRQRRSLRPGLRPGLPWLRHWLRPGAVLDFLLCQLRIFDFFMDFLFLQASKADSESAGIRCWQDFMWAVMWAVSSLDKKVSCPNKSRNVMKSACITGCLDWGSSHNDTTPIQFIIPNLSKVHRPLVVIANQWRSTNHQRGNIPPLLSSFWLHRRCPAAMATNHEVFVKPNGESFGNKITTSTIEYTNHITGKLQYTNLAQILE